ncbi:hypothetical protein [Kitasatospora sp. NPDC088134]|uniref:hypothetical protein n=1 Tax=Kitasatospora sp. NPDC088134 TaxID=3364071 RepID=UPI003810E4E0
MLALADWAGRGQPLTARGQLRRADTQNLVELLDTDEGHLSLQLEWARCIDLLRTDGARIGLGSSAARLREDPQALRKVLFATVPRLRGIRAGWAIVRLNLEGADDFSAGLVELWRRLRTGPLTEADAVQTVWSALTGRYRLEMDPPPSLATWKKVVGQDVVTTLGLYREVDAVQRKGTRFELTPYGHQRAVNTVRDHDLDRRKLGEAFIQEEVRAQTFHPDGAVTTELAPAVWTLAHRGYSGSGRLDIWTYTSRKSALKAGADLAMACGMDENAKARSLYTAGRYEELLSLYESEHPETHLMRVQSSFLQTHEM